MSTKTENAPCICASHNIPCDLACSMCDEDLAHILVRELGEESDDIDGVEFIDHMKEHDIGPVGTCAICGKNYVYGGNNPRPIIKDEEARCCTMCYDKVVIPALTEAAYTHRIKATKKQKLMELSPEGIVKYILEAGSVRVHPAGKTRETQGEAAFDIIGVEYNAPIITFKRADSEADVTIDSSKILWSYIRDGNITIGVNGEWGSWRLRASYDLEPRQTRERLIRAASIEAYLNEQLDITEDSDVRVYVRFRADQVMDEDGKPLDTPDYRYEMIVGSSDEEYFYTYADGMFFPLDAYRGCLSPEMTRDLTRGLMQKLLTADQHDSSNTQT